MNVQVSAAFQMAFISRTPPLKDLFFIVYPMMTYIHFLLLQIPKPEKKEKKNSNYFPVVHKDITAS